jgi:hypothetical protein
MKTLHRLWEFLFDRWKIEFIKEEKETWTRRNTLNGLPVPGSERDYIKNFYVYKYTNKFDGSVKIVRKEI